MAKLYIRNANNTGWIDAASTLRFRKDLKGIKETLALLVLLELALATFLDLAQRQRGRLRYSTM